MLIVFQETNRSQSTIIVKNIPLLLPAAITLFLTILKLIYAWYNSYSRQVIKALQGIKKDLANELGLMDKIKKEVKNLKLERRQKFSK